ncbi:MAG: MATE family efflux transporter [Pirellulaceae bacterium]
MSSTLDTEPTPESGNWWTRPCGGVEVLRIAMPLVISTGSWSLLLFVDRMLLMWWDENAMAAAFPAGMLNWTVTCFPMGVAMYVNTFVAQYYGAQRYGRIGAALAQGVWLGVLATPLLMLLIPLTPWIFYLAGHDKSLLPYETLYFQILCVGGGAMVIAAAQSSFFTGRGVTWVVMVVDVASVVLNIALDAVLIFGLLGLPELGIAGAAWATVVSQWAKVAVYWLLLRSPAYREKYGILKGRGFDWPLMRRLWRFGGPSGLQFLLEASGFTLIVMCMGRLDKLYLAATTIAFQINILAFVPMIGVGIAVSTLVGQQITHGRADLAARATWTATILSLVYTGAFALAYVAAPDVFLLGHSAGVDAADAAKFHEIRDVVVVLLRFVAAYCVFDAMQFVFSSAIKGAGDTRFVLITTGVMASLSVLVGQAGSLLGGQLYWWWIVVTGWISCLGVIYLARFLQGKWRRMRVIERDEEDGPAAFDPLEAPGPAVALESAEC